MKHLSISLIAFSALSLCCNTQAMETKAADTNAPETSVRTTATEQAICPICQDKLGKPFTASLPCPHKAAFHKKCINRWMNNNTNCPACRAAIPMDTRACSALLRAIRAEQVSVAQELLERGAHVNFSETEDDAPDTSPLNEAVKSGHQAMVKLLLKYSATINPAQGAIPLITATERGMLAIAELLLKNGAIVSLGQGTPSGPVNSLLVAVTHNSLPLTKLFLENGAGPNPREGKMPLLMAIQNRNHMIAELLLKFGAIPNLVSSIQPPNLPGITITPLELAWGRNLYRMTKLLLNHGAQIDRNEHLDPEGNGFLVRSLQDGNIPMAKLLLAYGANPDIKRSGQKSARELIREKKLDQEIEL